ncbi:MAG: hypothetical protein RIB98_15230 [Acidimicrobiales bacterium]
MDSTTTPHPAIRLIDELTAERISTVVPKAMAVDRLLDLRNLVDGHPTLAVAIDRRLGDLPGATMTPGVWWHDELRALRTVIAEALASETLCPGGAA